MDSLKIFLSHKSEYEEETSKLAKELQAYSIECFVAKNISSYLLIIIKMRYLFVRPY